jgi:hypothetical protein
VAFETDDQFAVNPFVPMLLAVPTTGASSFGNAE